jgi:dimethylhistidine N-methyltransferase
MREIVRHANAARSAQFVSDVQYYLTQQPRQLPSRYLYDALGSALFDAICHLPWYRITRAELGLLEAHARAIFTRLPGLSTIVELGPGSGEKLGLLVASGRFVSERLDLRLVDISPAALTLSSRGLAALPNVRVRTFEAAYEPGLREALSDIRAGHALVLLLGSNIGNFDPPGADALLRGVRGRLAAGDAFLVGADLVKPERELLLAYDDPLGVTAAFNRNLLIRINSELGADFDVSAFGHRAAWSAAESRVEMHLVSRRRQTIHIPAAELEFVMEEGETIWTESSYKYEPAGIIALLARAGFDPLEQWIDDRDGFALTLVEAI